MKRMTCAPGKYIQGPGELKQLGAHLSSMGKRYALAVMDAFVLEHYGDALTDSLRNAGVSLKPISLAGECTQAEAERIARILKVEGGDILLGVGGGKALDMAKAAAYYASVPVAVMPTAASTDAPCSSVSVLYHEDGSLDRYLPLRNNPALVIVDTEIIAHAPARLLSAGMGDALATYYEAKACHAALANAETGVGSSGAALAMAKACRDILFADGARARISVERQMVTPALENVTEANIYLSGIGFESGGLAAAHAINNALSSVESCHAMHGEKVAFGLLVQLALENAPTEEVTPVVNFCKSVGLPTTLAGLGLPESEGLTTTLLKVAEASCAPEQPMRNMPFPVTPRDVLAAIYIADWMGGQSK